MPKRSANSSQVSAAKVPRPSVKDEEELSDEEMRAELKRLGKDPGPINAGNRKLYMRQLIKLRKAPPIAAARTPPTVKAAGKTSRADDSISMPKGCLTASGDLTDTRRLNSKKIQSFVARGFIAPPVSAFTSDGELNIPFVQTYVALLLKDGVSTVYVNGTTGEGNNLNIEERKEILEAWVAASKGKLSIIAQIGAGNIKETCDLAMHASRVGVDAIAVIPPTYYKPPTVDSLSLYLEAVATCAPDLPLYYYHIPKVTGVTFTMESILDVISVRVPTFRGAKFSDSNLPDYNRCITKYGKQYQLIYSQEANLLAAMSLGAEPNFVGTQFNFAMNLFHRLLRAFQKGDMKAARIEQTRIHSMIAIQEQFQGKVGFPGYVKAVMKMKGMDVGPPRLPILPLSPDDYAAMESALRDIGFFKWS